MRGRERREGRERRVGRRRGGKGRAGQGRRGKGRERTTLRTPCRKFLATPLFIRHLLLSVYHFRWLRRCFLDLFHAI